MEPKEPVPMEIKTVYFIVTGEQPTQEKAGEMTSLPFERTPPSGQEIKDALKWFFAGVGFAVAAWFFGNWVIKGFVGPGVLFFGYGAAFLAAPISLCFGVGSLYKLFRSARKRKPAAALRWMWLTSLLGEDAVGARFGKPAYALSTLRRLVPKGFPFDQREVTEYIDALRIAMAAAADETTVPLRQAPPGGWSEAGPEKTCTISSEKELYPGVRELQATLVYRDQLQRSTGDNKTVTKVAAVLELRITQYFICSGGYWYPYDVTPAFERVTEEVRERWESGSMVLPG